MSNGERSRCTRWIRSPVANARITWPDQRDVRVLEGRLARGHRSSPSHPRGGRSAAGQAARRASTARGSTCASSRSSTMTDVTPPARRSGRSTPVDPDRLDLDHRPVGDRRLQRRRRALRDDPAARDHRDAAAQLVRLVHVVRRQQDRLAGVAERRDGVAQLASTDRIEPDRRLVEEQHRRVVQQAARDMQPLLHPARERLHPLALAATQPDQSSSSSIRRPSRASAPGTRRRSSSGCPAPTAGRRGHDRRRRRSRSAAAPSPAPRPDRGPSTRARPDVGNSSVVRILIDVVFPAPFGPSRPNSSPGSTEKLTSVSARTSIERRRNTPGRDRNVRQTRSNSIAATRPLYSADRT